MNVLGFEITRRKALNLQSVWNSSGWTTLFGPIRESYAGAWQRNVELVPTKTALSFSAVYRCVTGIASDIAKMRLKLSRVTEGIWEEVTKNQPWLPVLRQPNAYQSRVDFFESWMISKLMYGNTYVLKQREDQRGIVTGLHVLHPHCVTPLVAADGSVYYQINQDYLAQTDLIQGIETDGIFAIPASEIIHDRMAPLWHPLIGVPPLYACTLSSTVGTSIQNNSAYFFQNRAMPGGVLEAPGAISDETALRLKTAFQTNFGGVNSGKVAVLGDGLVFKPIMMTAEHAQQVEQFKDAVEDVARAFGYPIWKLSGSPPPYTKPDQGQVLYYNDCLHVHIVKIEESLDKGLQLPSDLHTEFDIDELLRMDRQTMYETLNAAGKFFTLDEQRFEANKPALKVGGDTVYKQEQEHAVEALFRRDQLPDPFGKLTEAEAAEQEPEPEEESAEETRELVLDEDEMRAIYEADLRRDLTPA